MEWVIKGAKVFAEENNTNIRTQIQLQFSSNSVELLTLFLCNTTTTTTLDPIYAAFSSGRARTPFQNNSW